MTIVSDRDYDIDEPDEEPTDAAEESVDDLEDEAEDRDDADSEDSDFEDPDLEDPDLEDPDSEDEADDPDSDDEDLAASDEHDDDVEDEYEDDDGLEDDEPTDELEDLEDEDTVDEDLEDEGAVDEDLEDEDAADDDLGDAVDDESVEDLEDEFENEDAEDTADDQTADEDVTADDQIGAADDDGVETPAPAVAEERRVEVAATPAAVDGPPTWSFRQMTAVARPVLAVMAVMGLIGLGLGTLRGSTNTARTEFVYTLDESVPDSFLREDRRLLTQVVTFKSDAVLTPVAERFDLTVDELRSKIDVETLDLSEVLRLDVTDPDPATAIAISRAVLDQYLQVITDAAPAGDSSQELEQRRTEITGQLAEADATRQSLLERRQWDATLAIEQEGIQRQIDLKNEQLNRMQGSLDDSLVQILSAARRAKLIDELEVAQQQLTALEADLAAVGRQRAALATATTTDPALLREIARLEASLTTIDEELAERDLAPLVASPIRELSQPLIVFRPARLFALQGMAIGLLAGVPLAALVAYRTRRRQLWFH